MVVAGDVRSEEHTVAFVSLAVGRFECLDIAFNKAGTLGESGPGTSVSEQGFSDRRITKNALH